MARSLYKIWFIAVCFVFFAVQTSPAQDFLPELVKRIKPSAVAIETFDSKDDTLARGSGFFIAPNRIITNRHVIERAARVEIHMLDGKKFPVKGVLAIDGEGDLALLQVDVPLALAVPLPNWTASLQPSEDLDAIRKGIEKRHEEAVRRLQTWIRQPSIAAENRGMNEGCELTMEMLRDAGFQQVSKSPTDGQPGIFATLDAGAPRTVGLYFMYDVKQADPSEWSSPPFDAALELK